LGAGVAQAVLDDLDALPLLDQNRGVEMPEEVETLAGRDAQVTDRPTCITELEASLRVMVARLRVLARSVR